MVTIPVQLLRGGDCLCGFTTIARNSCFYCLEPGNPRAGGRSLDGLSNGPSKLHDQHPSLYAKQAGTITPTFDEEVYARGVAASIYKELKTKDDTLDVPCFNDLARVQTAAYLPEYVWTYLKQASWQSPPGQLRFAAFNAWRSTGLVNHRVVTRGSIQVERRRLDKNSIPKTVDDADALRKGRGLLEGGIAQQAIDEDFDPVIEKYSARYRQSPVLV